MITQWVANKFRRMRKSNTSTVSYYLQKYNYLPDPDFWIAMDEIMTKLGV